MRTSPNPRRSRGEKKQDVSQHRLTESLQQHTHMSPLPARDDHSEHHGTKSRWQHGMAHLLSSAADDPLESTNPPVTCKKREGPNTNE
jgi:hypothetical protein